MDNDALCREKHLLRLEMKRKLALLDKAGQNERSAKINAALGGEEFRTRFAAVAAFLPLPGEPDLRSFLRRILREGKNLFLPRIDENDIVFHQVRNLDGDMNLHAYGMPEPAFYLPRMSAGEQVFFLVPGLAFDRGGGRLGRGKGYYDRFFQSLCAETGKTPLTLGTAFSCQIVENIPAGGADFRMTGLVTEEGAAFFPE
jgi:5-formyltetrahydrofolate cyclo-ligase